MRHITGRCLTACAAMLFGGVVAAQQASESTDRNLQLAVAQLTGMFICERIRGNFRTLMSKGRDKEERASGTMWIRECSAEVNGKQLALTLGGQGWRYIYRQKERAAAEFEVSQYETFEVDVQVEGEINARYQPDTETFTLWFNPVMQPQVDFKPMGEVEVESEGLWSSVVGGIASAVMQSPESVAYEQFRSMGRKRFEERFAKGYTAELNFCTGRLHTGFGVEDAGQPAANEPATDGEATGDWVQAIMHPEGFILDGPEDVDPGKFEVVVESDVPVQASLVCDRQADRLARSYLETRELPNVPVLQSAIVKGSERLRVGEDVHCPVTLALRPANELDERIFGFRYKVKTGPLLETDQQACR
ncbi:hypothetical protein F6455_12460 [Proteobacteria bacterium 005FR1]|nr:hypothetical protein [Proteobacteria bacterium 005FR1]